MKVSAPAALTVLGLCVTLYALGVPKANAQNGNGNGLDVHYYWNGGHLSGHFCPQATDRIKRIVRDAVAADPGVAAKLLRLHFHDCFVRGCDGSALIFKADHTAERDGFPNAFSLAGFDIIDKAKAAVEQLCPRTVSCADIVALAARDAVVALAGPSVSWDVPLGRKDGNISSDLEANSNLPSPFADAPTLITSFAAKGLSVQQLVLLSGAHTIGTANCTIENPRLYPITDPTLLPAYANYLKSECPNGIITKRIAMKDFLDSPSFGPPSNNGTFDNKYYVNVQEGKGAFQSDQVLNTNSNTKPYVDLYASNMGAFINDFKGAMIAMGNIGVLTTGYVRQNCSIAFS